MCAAKIRIAILAVSILSLIPTAAVGQSLSTRLEGTVVDAVSGLPVQEATVRIDAGEYACVTDAAGRFAFEHLPIGEHLLTVSRIGYALNGPVRVLISEDISRIVQLRLEPQPIELPGQRITGSRPDGPVAAQPVAILTREQICNAGFRDVAEALASLPGILVNPGRSATGVQEVTIRGESGKRIAVTLDGMPLAEGVRGTADVSVVPISAVERIEVRREGDWGDAAVGGAVRITTRKSFKNEQSATVGCGSFGGWQTSAAMSRDLGPGFGVLVAGEASGSGDTYTFVNDVGQDSTRGNTGRRAQQVLARIGGGFGSGYEWGLSALVHESCRGAPGALHLSTPAARIDDRRRLVSGEFGGRLGDAWSVKLQASLSDYRTLYHDSLTFPAHSRFDETSYLLRAVLDCAARIGLPASISGGVELYDQRLDGLNYLVPQRSFGKASRSAYALWGRAVLRSPVEWPVLVGSGQIVLGLRDDYDSRTSGFLAPQMGLAWSWGRPRWLGVNLGWGRSFHRPLLTSLFWKQDVFSSGNPELQPEKSREWNAGMELSPPRTNLSLSTNFFDRVCDGFIEWEKRYGGVWSPVNMPRARLVGREDGCRWSAFGNRLAVDLFHTLLWATDQSLDRNSQGKFLLFRPKHTYQVKVQSLYRGVEVRWDARWVDRRYSRKQNTKWLEPYRWFDVSLRYSIPWRRHLAVLALACENLTNEPAALLEGYPLPGRTLRAGLELQL